MTPRILGVTLARSGSKGVPGKNVRVLGGKPLVVHTIHAALSCSRITDYLVSTDSVEIAEIATQAGALSPFLRPAELATDTATSADALRHAVEWMEASRGYRYDYVIELMATNPLKSVEDIDACIDLMLEHNPDSVVAVARVGDAHPARVKRIENGFLVDFCVPEPLESRRQDLVPEAYIRCGSIYMMSRDELMIFGRRHGSSKTLPYVMPDNRVVNIDTELDWTVAEVLLRKDIEI